MFGKLIKLLETLPIIGRVFSFLVGLYFVCKKDFRLIQNLRRPIMVIGSSGKDMGLVISLINDAGFFRVEDPSKTTQNLDRIKRHSVIVVGYTSGESEINKVIERARAKSIPVIVYAAPSEINKEDKKLLHGYSYAEMANTPFRLVNLIFSILSTYKYGRE